MNFKDEGCQEPTDHPQPIPLRKKNWTNTRTNKTIQKLKRVGRCRNPTLAKCGGEAQHSQNWGLGVLRDSRMFIARQQGPKHLYIWSGHYARKDAGWRLFDHKKSPVVAGCFLVVAGCFCWPFSLFVTFFTARNFYKLLFTVERGKVCYFLLLFYCL
jgi:hypothetical protein